MITHDQHHHDHNHNEDYHNHHNDADEEEDGDDDDDDDDDTCDHPWPAARCNAVLPAGPVLWSTCHFRHCLCHQHHH